MATTLDEGVDHDDLDFDPTEALMSQWNVTDANDELSDDADEDDNEDDPEDNETDLEDDEEDGTDEGDEEDDDDQSEDDDEDGDDESDEDESSPTIAGDDARVTIKVDGEERTVSVGELKRLYGQEAALTRKSQEVSDARKAAETEGERYVAAGQAMLQRSMERFEPYSKIDWVAAQAKLDKDDFLALREEAVKAHEDVQFYQQQLDGVLEQTQSARQTAMAEDAKKCIAVLQDPETGIEGFNETLYNEIVTYAKEQGLSDNYLANLTDPAVYKLLDKARRLDAAKAKAGKTKKKAAPAPKKALKGKRKPRTNPARPSTDKAMSRLSKSGSTDSAADALLARWGDEG